MTKYKIIVVVVLSLIFNAFNIKTSDAKHLTDKKVTIFIHGSNAGIFSTIFPKFIALPQQLTNLEQVEKCSIYKNLLENLPKSDNSEFPESSFYLFGWSGINNYQHLVEASRHLYNEIKKLIQFYNSKNINPIITIVSHMQGGHIALNLAKFSKEQEDNSFSIDKLILLGTSIKSQTKDYAQDNIFKKIYYLYSSPELPQNILQSYLSNKDYDYNPKIKQVQIKIDERYLLSEELILDTFLQILPNLIEQIDPLNSHDNKFLININKKNKTFELISNNESQSEKVTNPQPYKLSPKVVIFVHGSHETSKLFLTYTNQKNKLVNANDLICKKYMGLFIAKILDASDPENFPFNDFYVFGWPGRTNTTARTQAAKILNKQIICLLKKYKENNIIPEITIITHSHGGNVALSLAKFIDPNNPDYLIDKLILLACPIQEKTKYLSECNLFKKIYNIYSKLDMFQILDLQGFQSGTKNMNVPLFSRRTFPPSPKIRQTRIKINDRAIFHIEFLLENFMEYLPLIVKKMDSLNDKKYNLIKISTRKNCYKIIHSLKD